MTQHTYVHIYINKFETGMHARADTHCTTEKNIHASLQMRACGLGKERREEVSDQDKIVTRLIYKAMV